VIEKLYYTSQNQNLALPNRVTFPWEEAMRGSINIWLVWVVLVVSVDREHGTGMDYIASASATHPVTQVGYIAVLINADYKEYCFSHDLCVWMIRYRLKINDIMRCNLCIYS
jgi:hypothetical protein